MPDANLEKRQHLIGTAFFDVFQPLLWGEDTIGIDDARRLMSEFNSKNGGDLMVRDLLACIVETDDNRQAHLTQPPYIALKVAQLVVDDCKVDLIKPQEGTARDILKIRQQTAQRVVNWLSKDSA